MPKIHQLFTFVSLALSFCVYACMCMYIHTHVYTHKHVYIHMYTHMCKHVYIHMYIYFCIYTHICVHIYSLPESSEMIKSQKKFWYRQDYSKIYVEKELQELKNNFEKKGSGRNQSTWFQDLLYNKYISIILYNCIYHALCIIYIYIINRTENPEIDLCKYSQLIFYKGTKTMHWRRESTACVAGKIGHPQAWSKFHTFHKN